VQDYFFIQRAWDGARSLPVIVNGERMDTGRTCSLLVLHSKFCNLTV